MASRPQTKAIGAGTGPYKAMPGMSGVERLFTALKYLNEVGAALSSERDINKLLETILIAAKSITHSASVTVFTL